VVQLVEYAPPKLVPGHTEDLKNGTCGLPSLVLGVDGMGARKRFNRGVAIDSPPVQHSLRKQPCGARSKQAEMGTTDH